jgi:dihydroorotate dehydrogenase (NAD+) catalytic subunit
LKTEFLGKTLSGPFTIPSGIVTCSSSIIQKVFDCIPEVGVLTTKSIGPDPRLGYREPILAQYEPGSFVNAVGLTNPGAKQSAELLAQLTIPDDRFLLISIFGGSVEEYVEVAKTLAPHGDGLELNLSCPHAKGYGMAMGQDPELVKEIVSAVKAAVAIPVIAKLTPNVPNIDVIAKAAVEGGADGICAINTMGPESYSSHGYEILSNGKGGVSGKAVLPRALECVRQIAASVDCPIIACGGISSATNVQDFFDAGAAIIGIGSALIGMTTDEIADYFKTLTNDLAVGQDQAEALVRYDIDMNFSPVTLVKNERVTEDIAILTFDRKVSVKAGEFVFLWIPGLGEKPFSALVDDPFTLVVINLGVFTSALMELEPGTEAYVRGPYGIAVSPSPSSKIIAVAGGTGLAAVYQIARDFGNTEIFVGARTKERLYFEQECEDVSSLHIATDDGSSGFHGLVTQMLDQYLATLSQDELATLVFYNCGPAPMVYAAEAVQRKYCGDDQIFNAVDYLTKCGVGICGACGAPDGRRLCVDGPFLVAQASTFNAVSNEPESLNDNASLKSASS